MMRNLIEKVLDKTDLVDNLTESGQERQQALTDRHRQDMQSDNWLSKSIRPLSLLALLTVVCVIGLLSAFDKNADPVIFGELVLLLGSAFGFYFDSRRREKIAFQNAKANIELEKIRTKSEVKQTRKEARHERRLERRRERAQDKED